MTDIFSTHDMMTIQSLSDHDSLDGLSDQFIYDETFIGVDNARLSTGSDAEKSIELFPELLCLSDFKEENDASHCHGWLEDGNVQTHNPQILVKQILCDDVCESMAFSLNDWSSDLTPPDSPECYILPEIHFDLQHMDTIMTSPLSPVDISRVLDTPNEVSSPHSGQMTPPIIDEAYSDTSDIQHTLSLPIADNPSCSIHLTEDEISAFISTSPMFEEASSYIAVESVHVEDDKLSGVDSDPDYAPIILPKQSIKNKVNKHRSKHSLSEPSVQTSHDMISVTLPIVNRKERKKEQNKTAATRYREKKREQKMSVKKEEEILESRNKELKDKVEQMSKEIQYMKNLMNELLVAKRKTVTKHLTNS